THKQQKMAYHIYSFEKLDVYQNALDLSMDIRNVLSGFPKEEQFDLSRPLKRSVDSIHANIAEGSGRSSNVDQADFTNMAFGSAMEAISHLNLAKKVKYTNEEVYNSIREKLDKVINQLNSLYKWQLNTSNNLKTKLKQ